MLIVLGEKEREEKREREKQEGDERERKNFFNGNDALRQEKISEMTKTSCPSDRSGDSFIFLL